MFQHMFKRVIGVTNIADPAKFGPIEVIDGDDIRYGGVRYRLNGYDAPEISNFRSKIDRELERTRGYKAMLRLREKIDAAKVIDVVPLDKIIIGNRKLARLLLDGKDIADVAVSERWACPYVIRKQTDWGNAATVFDDTLPLPQEFDHPSARTVRTLVNKDIVPHANGAPAEQPKSQRS